MNIEQVKANIQSNVGLVETLIDEQVDIDQGEYTRLKVKYAINLGNGVSTEETFIAHGTNGVYTLDKSYDNVIKMLNAKSFRENCKIYLDSLVGTELTTWDTMVSDDNPNLLYAKVYARRGRVDVPLAWLLTKNEDNTITQTETTFEQFPFEDI